MRATSPRRAVSMPAAALLFVAFASQGAAGQADDDFLATVNREPVAENFLGRGREMAAARDYSGAALMYATAAQRFPNAVVEVADHLYQPVWRAAVDELRSWPPEGLRTYRESVDAEAGRLYAGAVAAGDLQALESVATGYFLSSIGDTAAVALADRLQESGRFALALYYYDLALEACPDSRLNLDEVRAKAFLAAGLAGLDARADRLAESVRQARTRLAGDDALALAERMARIAPPQGPGTGGQDHLSWLPAALPATVAWARTLAEDALRSRYVAASTPLPVPAYRDGRLYVVFETSAWCLDAADGRLVWRHDAATQKGSNEPVHYHYDQAHRPVPTGETVITPLSSGDPIFAGARYNDMAELVALRSADGTPVWRWSALDAEAAIAPFGVDAAPVLDDHDAFAALATTNTFFGEVQTVAFDRLTGAPLWRRPVGAHNNLALIYRATSPTMPLGTALAVRAGVLLSAGGGLMSAQSTVSGMLLWTRQLPLRPRTLRLDGKALQDVPGQTFNGQINGRVNQVLIRGDTVIGGDATSSHLACCRLLTGALVWSREAGDSGQLLALSGDRVVTWGRGLQSSDAASGRLLWDLALQVGETIAGTPLVAQGSILVPTDRRLVLVDPSDGTVRETVIWPEGRLPGNLLQTPEGLVVAEPRALVCYTAWDRVRSGLLAAAEADGADPAPLIALGDAAMRLGRPRESLDYLGRALGRAAEDAGAAGRIFDIQEHLLRQTAGDADRDALAAQVFAQMLASARRPGTRARQGLTEGRYYWQSQPARGLAALHRVLASPETRQAAIDDPLMGRGPAGVLAERLINQMVATHGSSILEPFEQRAADARRQAMRASDPPAALHEAALRYPATQAARASLEAELDRLEKTGQHREASRLLRRLLAITPEGEAHWRYRLRLAQCLATTGRTDAARHEALILRRCAPPELTVTDAGTPRTLKAAVDRLLAGAARAAVAAAPVDLPAGPYAEAWRVPIPEVYAVTLVPTADYRDARARAAQPLLAVTTQAIRALRHDTGETVWEKTLNPWLGLRPVVPVLWTGDVAVLGLDNEVVAIDPATGAERWRTTIQPQGESVSDTVVGRLRYGVGIWAGDPTVQVLGLDLDGGLVRVQTTASVHLLESEDGYSCMAVGLRTPSSAEFLGTAGAGLAGRVPEQPGTLLAWDFVTGRRMPGFRGKEAAMLLAPGPEAHQVLVGYPSREVAMVDLSAGVEAWRFKGGPLPGRRAACCIGADRAALAVGTFDGNLTALDARSGQPTWSVRIASLPRDAAIEVTRLDDDILVRCARQVVRVTADGTVAWRHRFRDDDLVMAVRRMKRRLLATGRCIREGVAAAFAETLDLQTGRSDGRTVLDVPPGRFSLVPGEDGLLVVGPQSVQLLRPAPAAP